LIGVACLLIQPTIIYPANFCNLILADIVILVLPRDSDSFSTKPVRTPPPIEYIKNYLNVPSKGSSIKKVRAIDIIK
jgi:hypothetical protein